MKIVKKIFIIAGIIFLLFVLFIGFIRNFQLRKNNFFSSPARRNCNEGSIPEFSHHITDLSMVELIQPGGDVERYQNKNIIKSHSYVVVEQEAPIYAPIDSVALEGSTYIEEGMVQYSVFFQVTCDAFYLFDHIQKPVEKLKKSFSKEPSQDTRTYPIGPVEFSKGELIGYTKGTLNAHHFDFGLYDTNNYNSFAEYKGVDISERDRWSICPFDNFPENMKNEYYLLFGTIRSEELIPEAICSQK